MNDIHDRTIVNVFGMPFIISFIRRETTNTPMMIGMVCAVLRETAGLEKLCWLPMCLDFRDTLLK